MQMAHRTSVFSHPPQVLQSRAAAWQTNGSQLTRQHWQPCRSSQLDQSPDLLLPSCQTLASRELNGLHRTGRRAALLASAAAIAQLAGAICQPQSAVAGEAGSRATASIERAYDSYAPTYDDLDGGLAARAVGFDELRAQLVGQAQGQVLEVAVGTGLNLPFYKWVHVASVTGVDISQGMLTQAAARVAAQQSLSDKPIKLVQGDALSLDSVDSSSMDTVLDTYSLCVLPDPLKALQAMARVVKPASQRGRVLLLEHARSDNPLLGAYQDATADAVAATAKGCVWNQRVPELVAAAGLRVVRLSRHTGGTLVMLEAVRD